MRSGVRNVSLGAGALITALFVAIAAIAQFWTPYDPRILHIADKLQLTDSRSTGSAPISWAGMFCR